DGETESQSSVLSQETDDVKAAIETGDLSLAAYVVQRSDERLKKTELNIAITVESGAGKSSFLNALRGLGDEDEGSAETGVVETTKEPERYQHSKYPSVIFWDLPGIGTPDFKPDTYLEQVTFSRYDFFIILASERFRANHAKLAQEIRKMGKKFYFVRSKVDLDLYNEKYRKSFNEERTLEKIRNDCVNNLSREGMSSPQVFLVSSREFQKYDSPKLQKKLLKELESHKKHIFLLALPNLSQPILEKKKKALQRQIWKQALKSCSIAAVPLPALSVKCDVGILVDNMRQYCESFGLDDISLIILASQVRKSVVELKYVIKSPLAKEISKEMAEKLLAQATGEVTYKMLNSFLDGVAEDAQRVLIKALETEEKHPPTVPHTSREQKFIPGNKFAKDRNILPGVSEKETEDIKAALEAGDLSGAAYVAHKSDELLKKTELNIAITGESGAGKSSFLNALRGLGDEDKESAETGVVETTKEPEPYKHSKYPNVIFWDLPGIGTPHFKPDTYLEQVKFDRYDFFIILASERFRANHAKLAQEIRRMEKKFYFVRSKVDFDLYNEKRKQNFDEERTLEKIRNDCVNNLSREGMSSPQVFLVSSREFQKYDSPKLQKKLLKELESHKKHIFLLALPNLSKPILEKKKKALQRQIWKQALKSCAIAAVPLPALSVNCDVGILVDNMRQYCESFGLDDISLNALASQVRKPVAELKAVIKSPLVKDISKETAKEQLTKATGKGLILAKHFISMIPVAGTIFAAERSFTVTYRMLNSFLDDVAEDAQRVLIKALERENK
uniref:IRG-type G domain-containing protein n=1 Tax=Terrapene triunguis TaxID=2587831 RepID=A0A674I866_9SAUR